MIKSRKLSKFKDIEHAFFNRLGGKSSGIFKSLNCGPGSSDNKKNVFRNFQIVLKKIKSKSNKIFILVSAPFLTKELMVPSDSIIPVNMP